MNNHLDDVLRRNRTSVTRDLAFAIVLLTVTCLPAIGMAGWLKSLLAP